MTSLTYLRAGIASAILGLGSVAYSQVNDILDYHADKIAKVSHVSRDEQRTSSPLESSVNSEDVLKSEPSVEVTKPSIILTQERAISNPSTPSIHLQSEPEINYTRLYSDIKRHEGVEHRAYKDSRGYKTIGAGFNLDKGRARKMISSLGLDYDSVYDEKVSLSDSQIDFLMKDDVNTAIDDARAYLGKKTWNNICTDAREIVINIAYNRGRPGLMKFKGVKKALENRDYARAALELEFNNPDADKLVHTNWYNRTGNRAKELISRMRRLER